MKRCRNFLLSSLIFFAAFNLYSQGTVNAIFQFSNYLNQSVSVKRVEIRPDLPGPDTYPAYLSPYIPPFTIANTPSLANGTLSVSNIITGYSYDVSIFDGFRFYGATNFFPTNIIGQTVYAAQYKAVNINQGAPFKAAYLWNVVSNYLVTPTATVTSSNGTITINQSGLTGAFNYDLSANVASNVNIGAGTNVYVITNGPGSWTINVPAQPGLFGLLGTNATNNDVLTFQSASNMTAAWGINITNDITNAVSVITNQTQGIFNFASGASNTLANGILTNNAQTQNLIQYVRSQIGCNTNFIMLSGGTGSDTIANGTDCWNQTFIGWTNINNVSWISSNGTVYIGGIAAVGASGGYPVGSVFTNILGSGTPPSSTFEPVTYLAGTNISLNSSYWTTTISTPGTFVGAGTNISVQTNGNSFTVNVIPNAYDTNGAGLYWSMTVVSNGVYMAGTNWVASQIFLQSGITNVLVYTNTLYNNYVLISALTAGTNAAYNGAIQAIILTNNEIFTTVYSYTNQLNSLVSSLSNFLWFAKQPASLNLTNWSSVGTNSYATTNWVWLNFDTNGSGLYWAGFASNYTASIYQSLTNLNNNTSNSLQVQISGNLAYTTAVSNNLLNTKQPASLNLTNWSSIGTNSCATTNWVSLNFDTNGAGQYQTGLGSNYTASIYQSLTNLNNNTSNSLQAQIIAQGQTNVIQSNIWLFTKQPASTELTNLSLTGAFTNGFAAGQNTTVTTNANTVSVNATNQTFLTNGMTGIVFIPPTYYQPSSGNLTNLSLTGAFTNGIAAGPGINISTNGNQVIVSAGNQTNGYTSIVFSNPAAYYQASNPLGFVGTNNVNGIVSTNSYVANSVTNVSNQNLNIFSVVNNILIAPTNWETPQGAFQYFLSGSNYSQNLYSQGTNYSSTNTMGILVSVTNLFVLKTNGVAITPTITGSLVLGMKTNFVQSANVIGVVGNYGGTYFGNFPTSSYWTNIANSTFTMFSNNPTFVIQSNSVTVTAFPATLGQGTVVSPGASPAPYASIGGYIDINGFYFRGYMIPTNSFAGTPVTALGPGLTNYFSGGTNFINTLSNYFIGLINFYAVGPTNGVGTNYVIAQIQNFGNTNQYYNPPAITNVMYTNQQTLNPVYAGGTAFVYTNAGGGSGSPNTFFTNGTSANALPTIVSPLSSLTESNITIGGQVSSTNYGYGGTPFITMEPVTGNSQHILIGSTNNGFGIDAGNKDMGVGTFGGNYNSAQADFPGNHMVGFYYIGGLGNSIGVFTDGAGAAAAYFTNELIFGGEFDTIYIYDDGSNMNDNSIFNSRYSAITNNSQEPNFNQHAIINGDGSFILRGTNETLIGPSVTLSNDNSIAINASRSTLQSTAANQLLLQGSNILMTAPGGVTINGQSFTGSGIAVNNGTGNGTILNTGNSFVVTNSTVLATNFLNSSNLVVYWVAPSTSNITGSFPWGMVPSMLSSNTPSGYAYSIGGLSATVSSSTNAYVEFTTNTASFGAGIEYAAGMSNILGYSFPSPVSVSGESLMWNDFLQDPIQVLFQYSQDSNTWTTLASFTGSALWPTGGGMTNSFAPVTAQYFRWAFTNISTQFQLSQSGAALPDAQIYGSPTWPQIFGSVVNTINSPASNSTVVITASGGVGINGTNNPGMAFTVQGPASVGTLQAADVGVSGNMDVGSLSINGNPFSPSILQQSTNVLVTSYWITNCTGISTNYDGAYKSNGQFWTNTVSGWAMVPALSGAFTNSYPAAILNNNGFGVIPSTITHGAYFQYPPSAILCTNINTFFTGPPYWTGVLPSFIKPGSALVGNWGPVVYGSVPQTPSPYPQVSILTSVTIVSPPVTLTSSNSTVVFQTSTNGAVVNYDLSSGANAVITTGQGTNAGVVTTARPIIFIPTNYDAAGAAGAVQLSISNQLNNVVTNTEANVSVGGLNMRGSIVSSTLPGDVNALDFSMSGIIQSEQSIASSVSMLAPSFAGNGGPATFTGNGSALTSLTPANITAGANGQFLTTTSGATAWGNLQNGPFTIIIETNNYYDLMGIRYGPFADQTLTVSNAWNNIPFQTNQFSPLGNYETYFMPGLHQLGRFALQWPPPLYYTFGVGIPNTLIMTGAGLDNSILLDTNHAVDMFHIATIQNSNATSLVIHDLAFGAQTNGLGVSGLPNNAGTILLKLGCVSLSASGIIGQTGGGLHRSDIYDCWFFNYSEFTNRWINLMPDITAGGVPEGIIPIYLNDNFGSVDDIHNNSFDCIGYLYLSNDHITFEDNFFEGCGQNNPVTSPANASNSLFPTNSPFCMGFPVVFGPSMNDTTATYDARTNWQLNSYAGNCVYKIGKQKFIQSGGPSGFGYAFLDKPSFESYLIDKDALEIGGGSNQRYIATIGQHVTLDTPQWPEGTLGWSSITDPFIDITNITSVYNTPVSFGEPFPLDWGTSNLCQYMDPNFGFGQMRLNATNLANIFGGSFVSPMTITSSTSPGSLIINGNNTPLIQLTNENVTIGQSAGLGLANNQQDNIFVGDQAGFDVTGPENFGIGLFSLYQCSGSWNIGMGNHADDFSSGSSDIAIGFWALNPAGTGTSGQSASDVVSIGAQSGRNVLAGSGDIYLGYGSGINNTNANNNIEIGSQGLAGDGNMIRLGVPGTQTNTFIAGVVYLTTVFGTNGVAIGQTSSYASFTNGMPAGTHFLWNSNSTPTTPLSSVLFDVTIDGASTTAKAIP